MSAQQPDVLAALTSLRPGTPPVAFEELGGVAFLDRARDQLLDHDSLPALVRLLCEDTQALGDGRCRAFLLEAAHAAADPLLLEDLVAAFISSPAALSELGADLVDAWLDLSRSRLDLLGGIALEACARLVLAGLATPYGLLDHLRRLLRNQLQQVDDDFAERLVRVAGAVAEHHPAPEPPQLLKALLERDQVADNAAFELGMLALRQAVGAPELDQALPLMITARQYLRDAQCEEERPDAAAFGAAVDALLSYSADDAVSEECRQQLKGAVLELRLDLLGLPDGWRTPRLDTLTYWQRLIDQLERAQHADRAGAWLHAPALIRDLVEVYSAHRTLDLLPVPDDPASDTFRPPASGIHALLAPRVEQTLLAREGGLALLDEWLVELSAPQPYDDDPTTTVVREQAQQLRRSLADRGETSSPKSDGPAGDLAGLGLRQDEIDTINTFPPAAACLAAMYAARHAQQPVDAHPIVAHAYRAIQHELTRQCPHGYTGQFAADIDYLLLYLLRFMNLRLSETQNFGGEDSRYLRQLKKDEAKPLEKELGKDLRQYLMGQGLRVELEVNNVGAGRVDVAWRPHDELITLELKRDWTDFTWDAYQAEFLPQAISYQVSGPPLNFLVVLDLTDKPQGLAAFSACYEVRTVPGPAVDPRPRTVIMLRVQGNKRSPSSL
jgi:hypothetical protein